MSRKSVISTIKRDHLLALAAQGKRIDGRDGDQFRDLDIQFGLIGSADGSSRLKLGDTQVYCGVKLEPGTPYPDQPSQGVLTTSVELVAMAHPDLGYGSPREEAIEVARVVDRGIRESQCLDLSLLSISSEKNNSDGKAIDGKASEGDVSEGGVPEGLVWTIYIDLHVVNHAGNLFDACSLAAVSALMCTTVPNEKYGLGKDRPLALSCTPISNTFVKMGTSLFLDPGPDEGLVADARLTVTLDDAGDIRAMQKGLRGTILGSEVKKLINTAQELAPKTRMLLLEQFQRT